MTMIFKNKNNNNGDNYDVNDYNNIIIVMMISPTLLLS